MSPSAGLRAALGVLLLPNQRGFLSTPKSMVRMVRGLPLSFLTMSV